MIERKFVSQKIREFEVQEYLTNNLKNVGYSHIKILKTPLGEKITIYASRPGLVVGRKGQNIRQLTNDLKKRFKFENPQIEIGEIDNTNTYARIVAERIVDSLERFGSQKFKAVGHKVMINAMNAGALGIEIIISGKIPSDRAKSWRFYSGYLKKCGEVAIEGVRKYNMQALLKTGVIGVKVRIMPSDLKLPDDIHIISGESLKKSEESKKEEKNENKRAKSNE